MKPQPFGKIEHTYQLPRKYAIILAISQPLLNMNLNWYNFGQYEQAAIPSMINIFALISKEFVVIITFLSY